VTEMVGLTDDDDALQGKKLISAHSAVGNPNR
jgi:hypothetical protein